MLSEGYILSFHNPENMSEIRQDLLYTETHMWVKVEDNRARIGFTDFKQNELGDIMFVLLPEPDKEIKKGENMGETECIKTVEPFSSPISGKVLSVNPAIDENPGVINRSPYDDGWFLEMLITEPTELDSLLSPEDYSSLSA